MDSNSKILLPGAATRNNRVHQPRKRKSKGNNVSATVSAKTVVLGATGGLHRQTTAARAHVPGYAGVVMVAPVEVAEVVNAALTALVSAISLVRFA